ncbi:alkaline phosphatase-like [Mytilus californianus]|uniref:alkaline phosphatase-like n=1 Tax=Mytilus californianus TaxID=6549 RepID=UPI0022470275|nr:alkaline phosphatase-like [Mytilus californianus]
MSNTQVYWRNQAKDELHKYLKSQKIEKVARNVIFFLGDGMSIPTITAARIRQGQLNNKTGEENVLSWEKFPHVALSKTYNQDHQTPDSAGTATQFLCGIKTNSGVLGVDGSVKPKDCSSMTDKSKVTSIADWSLEKDKSVGIITTTRITHATPGAAYANTAYRNWEVDWQLENVTNKENCPDIAKQLINDYKSSIKVLMGGGRRYFLPSNESDPVIGLNNKDGRRDNRNLIEEWINDKQQRKVNYEYVWNATEFNNIDPRSTEYILGLFNSDHMSFELDKASQPVPEPTLAEMTEKAIRTLRMHDNNKGYFLLVEGGKIDWAHHFGEADYALSETIAMADAVAVADNLTSDEDTLIIVTADHSHTMTIVGYPDRGNPVLGLVKTNGKVAMAGDNLPYTTLAYANGPGAVQSPRRNLTGEHTDEKDFHQQSAIKMGLETHGGDDVAIFARGPMSHLFQGVHEQHYIAHVMAFASCVGEYAKEKDCAAAIANPPKSKPVNPNPSNRGEQNTNSIFLLMLLVFITV